MNAMWKVWYLGVMAASCAAPAISFAAPCSGTNINTTLLWEEIERLVHDQPDESRPVRQCEGFSTTC